MLPIISYVGNVVHDSILIIDWQLHVSRDSRHWSQRRQIILTISSLTGGPGCVGVVLLPNLAKQLDVVVAQGRGGPLAASSASTGQGVGGAGGHLLGGQDGQLSAGDGSVGLNLLGGCKGLGQKLKVVNKN